ADIDAGSRGRASLDNRDRGRVDRQLYRQRILRAAIAGGILCSVLAYMVHVDFWMALAAFVLSLPQFVFVPLLSLTRRLAGRQTPRPTFRSVHGGTGGSNPLCSSGESGANSTPRLRQGNSPRPVMTGSASQS